jgi:prepilin-type N-terminal cleavage/methylation domain-containing protein
MKNKNLGFTLIELIIVIAVIALLAAATFVAINPAKRVGDAGDATRWQDLTALADAFQAYLADNNGTLPSSTMTTGVTYMLATTTGGDSTAGCDIAATTTEEFLVLDNLITDGYIGQIPEDPLYVSDTNGYNTLYWLYRESSGKLKIGSCKKHGTNYPVVVR